MAFQLYFWEHLFTLRGLQTYAREILIAKGDFESFGQKWHIRFFIRYPNLKASLSRSLEFTRHAAANPIIYNNHFAKFKATREKYNIADGDTWNADKKGYGIGMPGKKYIIMPRDIRQGRISHNENREWATSIKAKSALGKFISLFVILAAETIKKE
jgi:hypothetical protein